MGRGGVGKTKRRKRKLTIEEKKVRIEKKADRRVR